MKLSKVISAITGMEVKQLISLILVIWFFTKTLRNDFSKMEIRQNHFDEKINDIMMRLARIEGMLSAKECCLLGSDDKVKKAE